MYIFFPQKFYFLSVVFIAWYLSVSSVYGCYNYSSSMLLFLPIQTSGHLVVGSTSNVHIKLNLGTAVGLVLLCLRQKMQLQQWHR